MKNGPVPGARLCDALRVERRCRRGRVGKVLRHRRRELSEELAPRVDQIVVERLARLLKRRKLRRLDELAPRAPRLAELRARCVAVRKAGPGAGQMRHSGSVLHRDILGVNGLDEEVPRLGHGRLHFVEAVAPVRACNDVRRNVFHALVPEVGVEHEFVVPAYGHGGVGE